MSPFYDIRIFGAAPSSTSNHVAIQDAIDFAYSLGGGTIFVPSGTWRTSYVINIKDKVQLVGSGSRDSVIENVSAVAAYNDSTCVNLGTYGSGNSASCALYRNGYGYGEVEYAIADALTGDILVTLSTASDADNFTVGDVVGLCDKNFNAQGFPTNQMVNEVVAKNGAALTMKRPLARDFATYSAASPVIAKFNTGNVTGYSGEPGHMTRGAELRDICLKQTTAGYQALHTSCYEVVLRNVLLIGSYCSAGNPTAYCVFEDVEYNYTRLGCEVAYYSHGNEWIRPRFLRIGEDSPSNAYQFAFLSNSAEGAYDAFGENIFVSEWATTSASSQAVVGRMDVERGLIQSNGGGEKYALLTSNAHDVRILANHDGNLVYVSSDDGVLDSLTVIGAKSGYNAIKIAADRITIRNCILGKSDNRTVADSILNGGSDTILINNTSYRTLPLVQFGGRTSYNTVAEATIKSITIPAGTLIVGRCYRVSAMGRVTITSTNSNKNIRLKIGSLTACGISYGASNTGAWNFDGVITASQGPDTYAYSFIKNSFGTIGQSASATTSTNWASNDVEIALTFEVADSGDTIELNYLEIVPIQNYA